MCLYFPGGSHGKASVYNVRDLGSIPELGRFPGEGNGNPLQYSCLVNTAVGSISGLRRSPEEGNDNPFQHPCLGNPGQMIMVGYIQSMRSQKSKKCCRA